MRQRLPLKTAADHDALERLTAEYLAAGHTIHRCAPKRQRNAPRDMTATWRKSSRNSKQIQDISG
jgi:hypothetical protein